ncbi:MAG: hypothetical protein QXQ29_01520 [Candidatus Bathyarchaeia archaeon]
MPLSRPLLFTLGVWIVADGIIAMILLYPPIHIWLIIRFVRVAIGFAILLEAQRVRINLLAHLKSSSRPYRYIRVYISLLSFIGVWLLIDGLTTGLLGYTHPVLVWQSIRIVRSVTGLCLIFMSFLYERFQVAG